MSAIRQRIADRLVASQQTTATLTTFNEADMSAVMALRNRYKDGFKEKHGVGLGFLSFFVKACVAGVRAFPLINARIDGAEVVESAAVHVGVAVSTDKGLMVPVVKDADRMSLAEIERAVAALAAKARDGKITPDDLQGGTFTITNGGVFGSLLSTPILNPPQSAILGMHTIQKRPVAVNDEVVVRPMMYLALSYDHRLIDGREAVAVSGARQGVHRRPAAAASGGMRSGRALSAIQGDTQRAVPAAPSSWASCSRSSRSCPLLSRRDNTCRALCRF